MRLEPISTGLTFPEGPRWRDGRLYFSDFYSHAVYAVDLAGNRERIVEVPGQPSGLGWLPDGALLVVSMTDQKLMRWDGSSLAVHADLSPFARFHCNDMIVLASGRAYVGNFGFDPHIEEPRTANLIRVETDGSTSIAAADMAFPNGMATLDRESILVVAESVGQCLTAFDILADGCLANRRILATLEQCQPDGICTDANGNILVTTMTCNQLVRFAPDGRVLATDRFEDPLWACAVTDEGETLVCTAQHCVEEDCKRQRSGAIQRIV